MSVNYTAGNFTVASQYVDARSGINVTRKVPSLDWSGDFSMKSINKDQCELVNRTGAALAPSETVRIARTDLTDVYKNSSIDAAQRLGDTRGERVLIQVNDQYLATNSLTGEQYLIPARAWICVETSVAPIVKSDIPIDVTNRVLGALDKCFTAEALSVTSMDTLVGALKGDLSPRYIDAVN
jgi:hypothetical protein